MMPYKIVLKVGKFHQNTASRFSTARQNLNRVKVEEKVNTNRSKVSLEDAYNGIFQDARSGVAQGVRLVKERL